MGILITFLVSGIFGHARAHKLVCGGTPTYYIPSDLAPKLAKARDSLSEMDGYCQTIQDNTPSSENEKDSPSPRRDESMLTMNIVPVSVGQEIELKQSKVRDNIRFYLHPFAVSHGGHPSLGYSIISRKIIEHLKEEYRGMDGKELGALVKSGVKIKYSSTVERVEVCYTGDSNVDGLINPFHHRGGESDGEDPSSSIRYLREGFTARLILCELTFLKPTDREKARERGHMNVMDIEPILLSHGWVFPEEKREVSTGVLTGGAESSRSYAFRMDITLVFFHISIRHRPARRILDEICNSLPSKILRSINCEVAISSFCDGSADVLTAVKPNGCVSLSEYQLYSDHYAED